MDRGMEWDNSRSHSRRGRKIGKSLSINGFRSKSKMKSKKGQFGEKLSLGKPFRVSIILRQEDRVAKNKKTKGRTFIKAKGRKAKRQKLTKKSHQDHGISRLTRGERANKKDERRKDAKRRKRKSGRSYQDIRRGGKTTRHKMKKNKNGREVNVKGRKDQQQSRGKSGQGRRGRMKRIRTRSQIRDGTIFFRSQIRRFRSKRKRKQQRNMPRSPGGGEEVKTKDGFKTDKDYCTGALIKENWIITAANCFDVSHIFCQDSR